MLILNKLTGRVHEYNGTMVGGITKEDSEEAIGVIPCSCEGKDAEMFEDCLTSDNNMAIEEENMEKGIWEPAPCLQES